MHYLSVAGFVGGLALGILTVPYAIKYTAMKDIEKPIYVACVTTLIGLGAESGRRHTSMNSQLNFPQISQKEL